MGAKFSNPRREPFEVTPEKIGAIKQHLEEGNVEQLRSLLRGTTRDFRRSLFATTKELQDSVFQTAWRNDLEMLRFLVRYCEAPFDEIHKFGVTPLRHTISKGWEKGALLLLKHGADLKRANVTHSGHLYIPNTPLIHLAVTSGSRALVRELIKRGADISSRDENGKTCLYFILDEATPPFKKFMFRCTMNWLSQRVKSGAVTENDLFFAVKSVFLCERNPSEAEDIITKQHTCQQTRMWQVLGAWLVTKGDLEKALHCWRKATQRVPCGLHDLKVDEDTTFPSVFADLLHVEESQLLEGEGFSEERRDNFYRQAVLIIERYIPNDLCLTEGTLTVVHNLFRGGFVASALDVLQRLTTIRVESPKGTRRVLQTFKYILEQLHDSNDVPFAMLFVSMKTAFKCFKFLRRDGQLNVHGITEPLDIFCPFKCWCTSSVISEHLFRVFVAIFANFVKHKDSATPQQLQIFLCQIRDFVLDFPILFCHGFFHMLVREQPPYPYLVPLLKIIVPFTAEAKDKILPKNLPHVNLCDERGSTPLHIFAHALSEEELLEEGVLQCFLDHSADLCTRNRWGKSVRDILVKRGIFTPGELLPSLQCLAAAAFMRNDVLKDGVHNVPVTAVKHFLMNHI